MTVLTNTLQEQEEHTWRTHSGTTAVPDRPPEADRRAAPEDEDHVSVRRCSFSPFF